MGKEGFSENKETVENQLYRTTSIKPWLEEGRLGMKCHMWHFIVALTAEPDQTVAMIAACFRS